MLKIDTRELEMAVDRINDELQGGSDDVRFLSRVRYLLEMPGFLGQLFIVEKDAGSSSRNEVRAEVKRTDLFYRLIDGIGEKNVYLLGCQPPVRTRFKKCK